MHDSLVIRSQPLVPVAILLVGGIVAARALDLTAGACAGALVSTFILVGVRKLRLPGIGLGILALGMLLYSARYRISSEHDLRLIFATEPELIKARGRMIESPALRDFYSGTNPIVYSYCTVEVSEVYKEKQWWPATGRIASRTRGELTEDFAKGRRVEITGVLEQPPRAAAPGLFDYRAYLHNSRIFFQLKCDSTNDWKLLSFDRIPLTERFHRWARHQLQRGLPAGDEQVQMIWAMTLGMKRPLSGESSEPFVRTGTMHIFAISGLHVACIAGFIVLILQVMGLPREQSGLLTVPLIWFYTLATGWQSSAIRAALMFTIIIAGQILRRPGHLLNSTAAAAVLILLFQPEQLFQAGFQLSFVVVASLALFLPAIDRLRPRFLPADPLLPRSLWPGWHSWTDPVWRFVTGMVAVSTASWIGSLPLTAHYFNIVTVSSFVTNIVAVPLSSVSLAATVFSVLVPFAGPVFNYFSWAFMKYTLQFTYLCAEIPFGHFYVPRPNLYFFLFYYAALLVLFVPRLRRLPQRLLTLPMVAGLGIIWVCTIVFGRPLSTITVLPCAGTPALVQTAGESPLLIDASSERDAEYSVKRFLRAQGLGSVGKLILTHGDAQNAGGFETIWDEFHPDSVITSTARSRSPVYRRILGHLEQNRGHWKAVSQGDSVTGWTILHPPDGRGFPRADDNALVLIRRIGNWTVLHLSDLGAAGQEQLIRSGADLRADIVIAGMPERDEPLNEELLEAISPRVIVLGTTMYPFFSEGTPELRKRLEESAAVFYTTESDAVRIIFQRDHCEIGGMDGKMKRFSKH